MSPWVREQVLSCGWQLICMFVAYMCTDVCVGVIKCEIHFSRQPAVPLVTRSSTIRRALISSWDRWTDPASTQTSASTPTHLLTSFSGGLCLTFYHILLINTSAFSCACRYTQVAHSFKTENFFFLVALVVFEEIFELFPAVTNCRPAGLRGAVWLCAANKWEKR